MRVFRIGVLGCGVISRTYVSDIQAFYPQLHVVACADVDISRARRLAEEYSIARPCTPEALL